MKSKAISFILLLVASLFAAAFTGSVRAQTVQYGPRLEHLRFKVISTFEEQYLAWARGEIDVLVNLTMDEVLWLPSWSNDVVTLQGWDSYAYDLRGAMRNVIDLDSWNYWTVNNIHWRWGYERWSDFNPDWTMAIFTLKNNEQYPPNPAAVNVTLIPANPTWDQLSWIYDSLIGVNPYDPFLEMHQREGCNMLDGTRDPDFPNTPGYLVEEWNVTDGPRADEMGMKVTFYLNTTVPIYWHDGHQFDVYDIAFAWEYLTANKILQAWSTFRWFHHCEVNHPLNDSITAYMTTDNFRVVRGLSTCSSSVWPFMWFWGRPRMFPEHVWGCTHERGGRATPDCEWVNRTCAWNSQLDWINNGVVNGTAGAKPSIDPDAGVEGGLCLCDIGTQDPYPSLKLDCEHGSGCVMDNRATPENEVLDYNPEAYLNPTPAYPWLTELIGTGSYVWYNYDPVAGVGNLLAFDERTHWIVMPGVHYWKTTSQIHNELVEMFWALGDVDLDGWVRVVFDLALMGANYLISVPPAHWRLDVNKDGIICMRDLSTAGRNYAKRREVGIGW